MTDTAATRYDLRITRWRERIGRMPLVLVCPLSAQAGHHKLSPWAARNDVRNSGAFYRCAGCGFTFTATLAQVDRRAIRHALGQP